MMQPSAPADSDKRPLPALWQHMSRVYSAMEDEAEDRTLYPNTEDESTGLVYEGHLTQLFAELNIPNPYYTSVTRALKAMGNIEQLRRGGGPSVSRWLLIAPPDKDAFLSYSGEGKTASKHRGRLGQLEQRMRDLNSRLTRLEATVFKEPS